MEYGFLLCCLLFFMDSKDAPWGFVTVMFICMLLWRAC